LAIFPEIGIGKTMGRLQQIEKKDQRGGSQMQINLSRIKNVRDKLEEALEEVERLLEELEASRPPPEPPPGPTKVKRRRRTVRRISE
jgi:ferric-dicitrate binding protein FerR (iron transport regulator)